MNLVVPIQPTINETMLITPIFIPPRRTVEAADGILLVSAPPKYQLPMLVNFPSAVRKAAFGPTLLLLLLNAPK
jgi:hypothetical protein